MNKAKQDGDRDEKKRRQIQIKECANQSSDWCGRGGLEQYPAVFPITLVLVARCSFLNQRQTDASIPHM